jgi:hypothetical protein
MEMIQLAAMPLRNAIQKEYVIITPSNISGPASQRRPANVIAPSTRADYNYQRFKDAEVRGDHGVLR